MKEEYPQYPAFPKESEEYNEQIKNILSAKETFERIAKTFPLPPNTTLNAGVRDSMIKNAEEKVEFLIKNKNTIPPEDIAQIKESLKTIASKSGNELAPTFEGFIEAIEK